MDEDLAAELRDQLRDMGVDEDSIDESLSAMDELPTFICGAAQIEVL